MNSDALRSEQARLRFEREIEITARLQHPNIARVYDSGVRHGVYYYAMELIRGVPLDEYVRRRSLRGRSVLALVAITCRALQHAHQRGVIHRDLKPSNILVDDDGQPHLVDFGLAKVLSDDADPYAALTVEGAWAGTPVYMSPEQASGKGGQLDTRTDVYSMGVLLYELLTGRLPHDVTGGHLKVMSRISEGEIVRPRRAAPDLDGEQEALLLKALSKDPDDRYPSGGALAEDISNYLRGEPLSARAPTALYFLSKKVRRHRLPLAAVAAGLVVLVAMGVDGSLKVARQRDAAAAAARGETELRVLAELRLADEQVGWGNELSAAGRWAQSREKYEDALALQLRHGVVPVAASVGILRSYDRAPPPVLDVTPSGPRDRVTETNIVISGGARPTISWVDGGGRIRRHEAAEGSSTSPLVHANAGVRAAHVGRDGGPVVCVTSGNSGVPGGAAAPAILVVDPATGNHCRRVHLSGFFHTLPVFSGDGARAAYVRSNDVSADVTRHELVVYQLLPAGEGGAGAVAAEPRVLSTTAGAVAAVCFAGDGRTITTATADAQIEQWDVGSGRTVGRHHADLQSVAGRLNPTVCRVAAAPHGGGIALGGTYGEVVLVSPAAGHSMKVLAPRGPAVRALAFSPDAGYVAAGDAGGGIRVWSAAGQLLHSFDAHAEPVAALAFSPDAPFLASIGSDGQARVWRLSADRDGRVVAKCQAPVSCVAVSPDGRLTAVGDSRKAVYVFETSTGRPVAQAHLNAAPSRLVFTGDGALLCAATEQNEVAILDPGSGAVLRSYVQTTTRPVDGVAPLAVARLAAGRTVFSDDARLSLHADIRGSALWNVATGERVFVIDTRRSHVGSFAPGAASAAVALEDNGARRVRVVDLRHEEPATVNEFAAPTGANKATAMAFTPGQKLLVVGDSAGVLEAFDVAAGHRRWRIEAHDGMVASAAITADGRTIISSGGDGTVRLFACATGRDLGVVALGRGPVYTALAGDASQLVAAGGDGNVLRAWDLSWAQRLEAVAVSGKDGTGSDVNVLADARPYRSP